MVDALLYAVPFENLKYYVEELLNAPRGYTVPKVETNLPYGVVFDLPMAEMVFPILSPKSESEGGRGYFRAWCI